jgi:16S rRNA U516 pseudouridylate synthase RsuA-like enzyme
MQSNASDWAEVRLPDVDRELELERRHLVTLDDQIRAAEAVQWRAGVELAEGFEKQTRARIESLEQERSQLLGTANNSKPDAASKPRRAPVQ